MKKFFLSLIGLAILSVGICSCNKEDNKQLATNNIDSKEDIVRTLKAKTPKKQILHYRGTKFETMPNLDDNGYLIGYDNLPEIYKEFRKDSNIISVTYVVIKDNYDDIYLFDDTSELNSVLHYESSNKNYLKAQYKANVWTFEHLVYNLMHTQINWDYKGFDWGKVTCYGWSLPWVLPQYNDKMSAIQLDKRNNESVHFMGCADANWCGQQLRISFSGSNSNNSATGNLHSYPYAFGTGWWPWMTNWGDRISSFEFFQTNGFLYGYQI